MKAIQHQTTSKKLRQGYFASLYSYLSLKVGVLDPWRSRTSSDGTKYINNSRRMNSLGISSAFLFTLLMLAIVFPLSRVASIENTEAATGTATNSSITFKSTRDTATATLTSANPNGAFASSTTGSTDVAFDITTNNAQGYELTIKSSAGTVLKTSSSAEDGTGLAAIASSRAASSFATNTWGYLPSYYNSDANTTSYYPITESEVTLRKTSSANSTAHSYTIGIGAKADYTRSNGTYTLGGNSGAITLSYVANPTAYNITFNKGNTSDTVSNMPYSSTNNVLSGSVSATSVTVTDGVPTRTGYDFKGWCSVTTTTKDNVDSCSGTVYNASGASTWTYGIDRTNSNTTTLYAMWSIKTFTCSAKYRLQGADGNFPTTYTSDTSYNSTTTYGSSCTYNRSMTDYRGSSSANNGAAGSVTLNNVTANSDITIDFYRNTYALTVSAGSNTSGAKGSGTYRWGEGVTVSVTKAANTTCTTYATPTWAANAGTAPTAGESSSFTMPKSAATVTATSAASDVAQTITLSKTNATGIKIDGTSNTGTSASLTCGSHTIAGEFGSGYEFSSWAVSGSLTLGSSTSTASNSITVSGAGTLTLTGKSSCSPAGSIYCAVASQSKGDFDMSTINTALTTANSGVYKYTGSHSDNGSSKDIYFYRGIIDASFTDANAGSSGDGTLYPNYVKLTTGSNTTCWRIFRTTGDGGVKMIYNGTWTGSTCANATTSAQLSSTAYYNRGNPSTQGSDYYGTKGFIVYAGYNYNNTYAYNNTGYTSAISNNTLFTNGTASNARTQVENWYSSTIGSSNNSLFQTNAGYCNDRSTYDTSNNETTTTIPYGPSTQTNFGARDRNYVKTSPSLACPYASRDLLTTSNGLGYPVALITIDEAVLAGNGYSNKEAYAKTSYLTSGSYFWSLSPYGRTSNGYVYVARVLSSGRANSDNAFGAYGLRPVVSLTSGTTIKSGSGTAADPWVVQ